MSIKQIRNARNLTQQELAEAIGVDESLISKYETGRAIPNKRRLQDISQALDVSVETLLNENCIMIVERKDL